MGTLTSTRAIVYIDGFNLYFGLVEKGWRKYLWLNLETFAKSMLLPSQSLVAVKYFTSRIRGPAEKKKRQDSYLSALETLQPLVSIAFGTYQSEPKTCPECDQIPVRCGRCGHKIFEDHEKMTDVNIACEILMDAVSDRFDTAVLVTGDADLARPVKHIKESFLSKRIILAFPPFRSSFHLKPIAHGWFNVGEDHLRNSQFPDQLTARNGYPLERPAKWQGSRQS